MTNRRYIEDMRNRCKDESDHSFVDSVESIVTEFEKPREPIDPYKYLSISPAMGAEWDKAVSEYCKEMGYSLTPTSK